MIRRFVNRTLLDKWGWGVGIADFYTAISRFVIRPTWLRSFLHGTWLGHPLHPLLTDVPVGGLTIAIVLDLFGVYDGANWATGLGVLGLVGAAIAGFVDLDETDGKARQYGGVLPLRGHDRRRHDQVSVSRLPLRPGRRQRRRRSGDVRSAGVRGAPRRREARSPARPLSLARLRPWVSSSVASRRMAASPSPRRARRSSVTLPRSPAAGWRSSGDASIARGPRSRSSSPHTTSMSKARWPS